MMTSVPVHFAKQHSVADPDIEGDDLPRLVPGARTNGHDLGFDRLFLGGIGNDDPAWGFLLGFDAS